MAADSNEVETIDNPQATPPEAEASPKAQEAAKPSSSPEVQRSKGSPAKGSASSRRIPPDFSLRFATKITALNERELDENIATSKVANLIYTNLSDPEMYKYFIEIIEILMENEESQKYAATTWVSLVWHEDDNPDYKNFVANVLDTVIDGHRIDDRPKHEEEQSGKNFSAYAYSLGEAFIQMMKLNSDLYEVITDIFSQVIKKEMAFELKQKSADTKKKKITKKVQEEKRITNPKKLYDDIVDYVSQRGDFRSDTLNQKNPNEFIIVLADRMRSTRRYIIQDIMNRHALEKKKQLEKELREREASAEEVITCASPFNHGLFLYWVEKRYNFKYLAVEKVRITLQVLGFFMGIGSIGGGYLGLAPITLIEGIFVSILMFGFSKLICSRYFFAPFFPRDVTTELEQDVSAFTPVFRKMSLNQINAFMSKQIRSKENNMLLHLLPEYIKYIFAVMPDRNNILLSKEDINEFMERLEMNISKFQRGG